MTGALVEAVALATLRREYGLPWADPESMPIAMRRHRNTATAALQAIEAAGYRVVPVEATFFMTDRGYVALCDGDGTVADASDCWSAMLSAAPRVGEGS